VTEICTLVLASRHEAKLTELRELFANLGVRFREASELGLVETPLEEDVTLEAAAAKKARDACRATGLVALAEKSGLEVDALGGRPGAHSATFAHERATDAENNAALLRALEDVPEEARTARFRSVIALASPWSDQEIVVEGRCEGRIARAARGSGGFGYDPLFVLDGAGGKSLAELDPEETRAVSPRIRAALEMRARVRELLVELVADADRILA
jgi:XTP/dITP diphosphohydrolase